MASFRWSQQGALGVLPNGRMENTFMAHAHDLQDPWSGDDGACLATDAPLKKNAGIDCSTPWFMGAGIHPRFKKPVGQRLALGALQAGYGLGGGTAGGTISGCTLSTNALTLTFDMPKGRTLSVRAYNRSGSAVPSATSIQLNGSTWQPAHVMLSSGSGTDGGGSVTVELPANRTITAVRYAWGGTDPAGNGAGTPNGDDVSCCEGDGVGQPCLPVQCPIVAIEPLAPFGALPVDPFIAKIVNGKCLCPEPQVCDA